MKGLLALALGTLLTSTSALSDKVLDVDTASGKIKVVKGSDLSKELHVGASRFYTDGNYQYVSVVDKRGSLYLIGLNTGGNACPSIYAWLHTENGKPRVTETFGTCSDLPKISSDSETVTVTLPDMQTGKPVAYVYDGRTIIENGGKSYSDAKAKRENPPSDYAQRYGEGLASQLEQGWHPACAAVAGHIRNVANTGYPSSIRIKQIDAMVDRAPSTCFD